jgi:glutamate-5-semialdehyde dehydrogenase
MTPPEGEPSTSREALVEQAGRRARMAAPEVAALPSGIKNAALGDLADALLDEADPILEANERDVTAAERARLPETVIDRFTLTYQRLGGLAHGVRAVAALPDPVGEVLRGSRRPNGLVIQEMRVPLGVVGLIIDSRPSLTIDAVSLCLKAGNAVLFLAGSNSVHTDVALLGVMSRVFARHGVPDGAVQLIEDANDGALERFIRMTEYVDVLVPRGSHELVQRVCASAAVPTIETGPGNCHIFVERSARLDIAGDIIFNAKVQRPGASNSVETLLVDRAIAGEFLPIIGRRLSAAGVELRGCDATRKVLSSLAPATEEDWYREYLDLILAVRVVEGLDHAIGHIARYGSGHSEAIVTSDYFASRRFCERVDAAAVYVNASTRFTDGAEFGLGAELGVSTQKLHRRGPLGLRALTTWKWIVLGNGQLRD